MPRDRGHGIHTRSTKQEMKPQTSVPYCRKSTERSSPKQELEVEPFEAVTVWGARPTTDCHDDHAKQTTEEPRSNHPIGVRSVDTVLPQP